MSNRAGFTGGSAGEDFLNGTRSDQWDKVGGVDNDGYDGRSGSTATYVPGSSCAEQKSGAAPACAVRFNAPTPSRACRKGGAHCVMSAHIYEHRK